MKKLIYFLLMIFSASFLLSCNDDDPVTPTPVQVEGDDNDEGDEDDDNDEGDENDEGDDGDEEPVPVTELKLKVDGGDFTYKILKGRFFADNSSIDIEVHELDDTFDKQQIFGVQIDFRKVNAPGEFDIANLDVFDVVIYFNDRAGISYIAKEGTISIKKISETRLEMTFASITLEAGTTDPKSVTLTDGAISVDLLPAE